MFRQDFNQQYNQQYSGDFEDGKMMSPPQGQQGQFGPPSRI